MKTAQSMESRKMMMISRSTNEISMYEICVIFFHQKSEEKNEKDSIWNQESENISVWWNYQSTKY